MLSSEIPRENGCSQGWEVEVKTGPGCLGPKTSVATAKKGETVISATAGDPETARAMLADMIAKWSSG